jgi:hypothetical protein
MGLLGFIEKDCWHNERISGVGDSAVDLKEWRRIVNRPLVVAV